MIKLEGKKFLVTGAAGFIGSHVAEELVKQGKEVICVDNLSAGKYENLKDWWDDNLCTFIEMDVSNFVPVAPVWNDVDVVFHLAASKCTVCRDDPLKDLMVNAWGSFCVFKAAQEVGAKVIHISTGSVMDGQPKSFYGVSKLAGEAYLRAFSEYHPDFRFSAVRIYHVYGPRQDCSEKGGVIPIFIRRTCEGKPIVVHGSGNQVRHFTHVKDVVGACLHLAEMNWDAHYFNFLNHEETSILQLAQRIPEMMGRTIHIEHEPSRPGDIKQFNVQRTLFLPGPWQMTPLSLGLQETIDWYVNQFKGNLNVSQLPALDGMCRN